MKKSTQRLLAIFIAALMLISVIPMSAFAADEATAKKTLDQMQDGDVLLTMDTLNAADLKSDFEGVTATQIAPQNGRAPAEGEVKDAAYSLASQNGKAAWTQYGVTTNLPLTTDSKYTIDYEVKLPEHVYTNATATTGAGMAFAFTANNNGQGIYPLLLGDAVNATHGYTQAAYSYSYKNDATIPFVGAWTDFKDADGYTHFTLEVDGTVATLYVGGVEMSAFDFTKLTSAGTTAKVKNGLVSNVLTLVFKCRLDKAVGDGIAFQVKNVKVTAGLAVKYAEPAWEDGDLLLSMKTLNSNAEGNLTANPYNIPLSQIVSQNCAEGALADGIYAFGTDKNTDGTYKPLTDAAAWTMYGMKTGLPLNETSKYTVEFYAKIPGAINIALTHSFHHNNNATGLYIYPNSIAAISGYNTQTHGTVKQTTFKNVWTGYKMSDGYTRFSIEVDGVKASMYVGGVYAATYDFTEVISTAKADVGYNSSCLSLVAKGHTDKTSNGDLLMQIKNISVYAGHHATDKNVVFVGTDGNVISSGLYKAGDTITEFPAITPAEGKQIVWFYEGSKSSIIEMAPMAVTDNMTLRAYEMDLDSTSVAGVQFSAVAENKVKIRFVGSTINLRGTDVGFEITANYKNNGADATSKWTRTTSSVFTTLNATRDGSIESVQAKNLGGMYLFALDLTGVPTNAGEITFTVKTFKTVDGAKVYGETAVFTLTFNGNEPVITPVQA